MRFAYNRAILHEEEMTSLFYSTDLVSVADPLKEPGQIFCPLSKRGFAMKFYLGPFVHCCSYSYAISQSHDCQTDSKEDQLSSAELAVSAQMTGSLQNG